MKIYEKLIKVIHISLGAALILAGFVCGGTIAGCMMISLWVVASMVSGVLDD